MATLDELKLQTETGFTALMKELKAIRKSLRKVCADIDDPSGEKTAARAQNNGFNKPLGVSSELRAFLSLGPEDKISRSQVTKKVNEYTEAHGLKEGQFIKMDATLKSLLNPPEGVQVTFLNIQKYINPHYVKEPKVEKVKKGVVPIVTEPVAQEPEPKPKKKRPVVAKPVA